MREIPLLYERTPTVENPDGDITRTINPECVWVIENKARATIKFDGVCCFIKDGQLYRLHVRKYSKLGREKQKFSSTHTTWLSRDYKTKPPGWVESEAANPLTGRWPGWIPVGTTPNDKWYNEAFQDIPNKEEIEGVTCELVGPKINRNPHNFTKHRLLPHGCQDIPDFPYAFDDLRTWLTAHAVEGVVFYGTEPHQRAKIRRKDFGLPWPIKREKESREIVKETVKETEPASVSSVTSPEILAVSAVSEVSAGDSPKTVVSPRVVKVVSPSTPAPSVPVTDLTRLCK